MQQHLVVVEEDGPPRPLGHEDGLHGRADLERGVHRALEGDALPAAVRLVGHDHSLRVGVLKEEQILKSQIHSTENV